MEELAQIQEILLEILYDNINKKWGSTIEQLIDKVQMKNQDLNEVQIKRALNDGGDKGYFTWMSAVGLQYHNIQIDSVGIYKYEEISGETFFKNTGNEILNALMKEWTSNPTDFGVDPRLIIEKMNEIRDGDQKIDKQLFKKIGDYLEGLGLIDKSTYYDWRITPFGRKSLQKIEYILPDEVNKITLNHLDKLKERSKLEGSFIDQNKKTYVEFKSEASQSRGIKIARVVSSFANIKGGHIIVGVEELNGQIINLNGINPNEVENILKSFIHLTPQFEPTEGDIYKIIELNNGNVIIIFFIPRMPRLYGVKTNNKVEFYKRIGPQSVKVKDPNELVRMKDEKALFRKWSRLMP